MLRVNKRRVAVVAALLGVMAIAGSAIAQSLVTPVGSPANDGRPAKVIVMNGKGIPVANEVAPNTNAPVPLHVEVTKGITVNATATLNVADTEVFDVVEVGFVHGVAPVAGVTQGTWKGRAKLRSAGGQAFIVISAAPATPGSMETWIPMTTVQWFRR